MTRQHRSVSDRLKYLEDSPTEASMTIAAARLMYTAVGGREFHCTVNGYSRTRIFEFPGIDFQPDGDEPHHTIYESPVVRACVATELQDYFENWTPNKHYSISPSLRQAVAETESKIKSQANGGTPMFLVIEESNPLTPVTMSKGECSISPEVVIKDGEAVPAFTGGRAGQEFLMAWQTIDGAWPQVPNNELRVNMVLAGVRVGQRTSEPIRKHLDKEGVVTDDGQFVVMMLPRMSARVQTATPMAPIDFRVRAAEIKSGITAIEQDIKAPHMALLINSMYRDDYKDDTYQRLHYLGLWQALKDAGRRFLNYRGSFNKDKQVIAGRKTLQELSWYRDDIAHWWTNTIDENYLADLQRTINELIRHSYFK